MARDDVPHYVVGVDFGTTYCGVAYVYVENSKHGDIQVLKEWPGSKSGGAEKVPTELSYSKNVVDKWGYLLKPGAERYGGFKLLLDKDSAKTVYDDDVLHSVIYPGNRDAHFAVPPGRSDLEAITDYMKPLYTHLMKELQKKVVPIDTTPIRFVLTTPAIWTHEAHHLTCQSVKKAGFTERSIDTIIMISEPEAAVLYSVTEIAAQSKSSLTERTPFLPSEYSRIFESGEHILLCDAGGGTVDLTTYTVTKALPELSLKETIPGVGGKCGSTTLDANFLQLLRDAYGSQMDSWPAKKTGRGSPLMNNFYDAKCSFREDSGTAKETWDFELNDDDSFELTAKAMAKIFQPVVDKVTALISSQISDLLTKTGGKMIILVGGLGSSDYLHHKISTKFSPLRVCKPDYPWSSVARGAVVHGVQGFVETRMLKRDYGIDHRIPFDETLHKGRKFVLNTFNDVKMLDDYVKWIAKRGQEVSDRDSTKIPCTMIVNTTGPRETRIQLYSSKSNNPSDNEADAERFSKLICDYSAVPDSEIETSTIPGRETKRTDFTIEMYFGSAHLTYKMTHKDKTCGDVDVEY